MITCREAVELIPLHVGDDLPGEEASRIEEHLESCVLCSAEYASYASARDALLELREEMPHSGSLWADVSRSLGTDIAAAALTGAGRPPRLPRWAAWTGLAAAAALALAFLPGYLNPPREPAAPDGGAALAAGAPQIEPTSDEELRAFLLKVGGRQLPSANGWKAGDELLPLTTPASSQPPRKVY